MADVIRRDGAPKCRCVLHALFTLAWMQLRPVRLVLLLVVLLLLQKGLLEGNGAEIRGKPSFHGHGSCMKERKNKLNCNSENIISSP